MPQLSRILPTAFRSLEALWNPNQRTVIRKVSPPPLGPPFWFWSWFWVLVLVWTTRWRPPHLTSPYHTKRNQPIDTSLVSSNTHFPSPSQRDIFRRQQRSCLVGPEATTAIVPATHQRLPTKRPYLVTTSVATVASVQHTTQRQLQHRGTTGSVSKYMTLQEE